MVSDSVPRPVERRLSAAGPSPVNSEDPTRLTSASPKPAGKKRLSIILIALAAIAVGFGAYFAFRSNPTPQPAPAVDTAAIAQTLETEPIVVDNSAAEAAAAAEAERQRLAEQERQRQEEAERQRREEEQRQQVWQNHRTPRNLYLAVQRGGNQYYFSESDWNSLPTAQKSECRKLGVVINNEGERFILALEDDPGEYTWQEAMNRFGNRLPTKQQGKAWITQQEAVQRAVRAFGGYMPGPNDTYHSNVDNTDLTFIYWTRTEYDSSYAWFVSMYNGIVNYFFKTNAGSVRAVAPVPVASAI